MSIYTRRPGKIRQKLAEHLDKLLAENGVETDLIDPADIWQQRGVYATKQYDCALWGVHIVRLNGPNFDISSWDTMTDCARQGIDGSWDGHTNFEVSTVGIPTNR